MTISCTALRFDKRSNLIKVLLGEGYRIPINRQIKLTLIGFKFKEDVIHKMCSLDYENGLNVIIPLFFLTSSVFRVPPTSMG